jgi:hypothetical protein
MAEGVFRKGITLMLFIMFVLSSTVTYSEDRTITKKEKKAAASSQTAPSKYYVLIIGINDYKYLPKLTTALNDAREVDRVLKGRYGFETKVLINATRDEIMCPSTNIGRSSPKATIF